MTPGSDPEGTPRAPSSAAPAGTPASTRWTDPDGARWTEVEAAQARFLRPTAVAARPPRRAVTVGVLLLLAWVALAWWFVLSEGRGLADLFAADSWRNAARFVRQLAGAGSDATPAFARPDVWGQVLRLAVETVQMSVLGAGIAGLGALATVAFAARTLTTGELASRHPAVGWAVFLVARGSHTVARAVPDLVWALLIVFVVDPGIVAGALALGLHNYGVLGRLGADVVEDVDPGPVRNLRAGGAGNLQVLTYGVLPQVLPTFLTFLLYRWEVIIRATAVVGFVTAAGLGYQLRLALNLRRFTEVALVLVVYVALVWLVDLASAGLRRLAR